jgi:hypothetical protein
VERIGRSGKEGKVENKRWVVASTAILLAGAIAGIANAGGAKVHTFGTGDVSVAQNPYLGTRVTIVNDEGEYGGVYAGKMSGAALSSVKFSFVSIGDVQGGAPRWSIPIDTDGAKKTTEGYAFLDAANCGATVGDNPDSTATYVSTTNTDCKVFFGAGEYANWPAFGASNPTYRLSKDVPFIIADVQGSYDVFDLRFFK